ncbi:MAG: hypothetical protein RLZZ224_2103 [Verrucomicrobiota bacterium]|jgi:S1-C subfamily serine protease
MRNNVEPFICMIRFFILVIASLGLPIIAQELPLQKEQDRAVLRRQSGEVFDVVSPISQKAGKSAVWVWAGGKRQLCLGTVVGDGSQVLAKWSEIAKVRGLPLQCVGSENQTYDASVVGVYEDEDMALLQLKNSQLRPVSWANSELVDLGQFLIAAGPGDVTLGMGVVSVKERVLRDSDQAYVGVAVENGSNGEGVLVRQVADGSPAAQAGLKEGDLVVSLAEKSVSSTSEFRAQLAAYRPGDRVKIVYLREQKKASAELILAAKQATGQFPQRRLEVMERMGGEISQVRDGFPAVIQTDMVLHPEECGGPILNLRGEVIGMSAARAGRIRSYVIPASTIKSMLTRKPVAAELAKVRTVDPGPTLSRTRQVRPRLNRNDMERMRQRMREMQQFMQRLDEELGALDR